METFRRKQQGWDKQKKHYFRLLHIIHMVIDKQHFYMLDGSFSLKTPCFLRLWVKLPVPSIFE